MSLSKKPHNTVMPIVLWVDEYTFLTKHGHLGTVLALKGVASDCLDEATYEAITARKREALKRFGEEFQIFEYVIKNDGAQIPVAERYTNPVAGEAARARKEFLETKEGGLYESGLYFCVLYKPKKINSKPRGNAGGISLSLFEPTRLRILSKDLDQRRGALLLAAKSFITEMNDVIGARLLSKKEAKTFFRYLANFDPVLARSVPMSADTDTDYRIGNVALNLNPEGISSSNRYLRVLSLKETPQWSSPNMFRDLYRIKANFILCMQFEPYSHTDSIRQAASASTHFTNAKWMQSFGQLFTMVANRFCGKNEKEGIIVDEGANDNLSQINQLSRALNSDVLGELIFTIIFHGRDDAALDGAVAEAIGALGQYEASAIVETYGARDAYLSIFPGNKRFAQDRIHLMLRSSFADMSLIYRKAVGEQKNAYLGTEYLFVAENTEGEPYYVSTDYNGVNNTYMSGVMGAGKSVLANKIIEGHLKNGACVLVLDQGHGYRELCQQYGGAYFHFDFERQPFFINPFSLPGTRSNIRSLATFVRLLLRNNGYEPTLDDNRSIWDGINELYEGRPDDRRLRRVSMRREARLALSNWIENGEDAWLFDNSEDSVTFSEFQVFEFGGAEEEEMTVFLEPLLFYIFKRWEQVVQDPATLHLQKLLHADEVWRFFLNDTVRRKVLSAGKRHRKHNGGLCLVTQSPEDLRRVGLLEAVNELCPTKMWLSIPNADIAEYSRLFGWNAAEAEAFQKLAPRRDVLVKKGERPAELFQLNLSPEELALIGNDPIGNVRREEAKRKRQEIGHSRYRLATQGGGA